MEPQIQYAKTSDGVSIAYYAIGQGPATLFLMMPTSHLEAEWQIDPLRIGLLAAAQQSTIVRLDPREGSVVLRAPALRPPTPYQECREVYWLAWE